MATLLSVESVKQAIDEYSGIYVDSVEIIADPRNSDIFAFRAFLNDRYISFLWDSSMGPLNGDELEEVEFESWPPKSNESSELDLLNSQMAIS
jgi:hypothetical protein